MAPLRCYLARLLGNPSDAQDVAHDAYLRVYPKIQDQSALKPEAVLYTTARRLAINRLKRSLPLGVLGRSRAESAGNEAARRYG